MWFSILSGVISGLKKGWSKGRKRVSVNTIGSTTTSQGYYIARLSITSQTKLTTMFPSHWERKLLIKKFFQAMESECLWVQGKTRMVGLTMMNGVPIRVYYSIDSQTIETFFPRIPSYF